MAQPRKHENDAARQAACRKRRQQAQAMLLSSKGLPALPGVDNIPGWPRWRKGLKDIEALMAIIEGEMENYQSDRSERWLESDSGEDFQEKFDAFQSVREQVAECLSTW
jgi:hypothetical protein